jgi:hypothetical protein
MNEYVAFAGSQRIAQGGRLEIVQALRQAAPGLQPMLAFELETGAQVDFDLTGSQTEIEARYGEAERGRGRPKLGVVAREVTLLPRHWDWLNGQRGGASAALRRLVDAARRADGGATEAANARAAAYRLLSALAGDWPHFEAAARALFADDFAAFEASTAGWPSDVVAVARARWRGVESALSA